MWLFHEGKESLVCFQNGLMLVLKILSAASWPLEANANNRSGWSTLVSRQDHNYEEFSAQPAPGISNVAPATMVVA